jgi:hypothetical protein
MQVAEITVLLATFFNKVYPPFNAILVSEHGKVRTPVTIANRHFNGTDLLPGKCP